MPRFLIAVHHPDNYDPGAESEAMRRDIDELNEQMVAAGHSPNLRRTSVDSSATQTLDS